MKTKSAKQPKRSKAEVQLKDITPRKDPRAGRNLVTTLSKDIDRVQSP